MITTKNVDPRWAKAATATRSAHEDLIVDIEAILDPDCMPPPPKNPLKEGGEEPAFPGPAHWRVVTIATALLVGKRVQSFDTVDLVDPNFSDNPGEDDEAQMLRQFVAAFNDSEFERYPRVVGWNTRGYDLPVIAHRCMRHGIPWPWYYSQVRGGRAAPRYRYASDSSLDLMDWMSDHGSSRKQSLDSVARLIGLPGKAAGPVTGADVAQLHAEGRSADIEAYCRLDVAQTTAVYLRFELVRGALTLEEYQASITSWVEACERSVGPDALLRHPATDFHRLMGG